MNTSTIKKILTSDNTFSALPLRLVAGIIFTAHGAQKLFAWFGGYGLEGTGQWMESIGLAPGYLMAMMAGSAEFFGGLLLILGLLTRPTALVLSLTMIVAIFSTHIDNGLFVSNSGYEFALALFAISLSVMLQGGGKLSIDRLIVSKLS
ncbi:DoxX family protein [Moritella viscosa]|uniref:Membrane DoxD-like family protein n=1 Tax=Moritella viscosa TaxID=80854 RepID=A0ABY1HLE0_9GAMM|nr:DoxX family protein [Moritella viscosa]SGZ00696.1 Putative membrane DoxD-like family protein [Moritella viscosa]SGZ16217.1 Putative membrane DoxD-like family protein [Moritella viscosa]SHO28676.1 Putative membrane DoxD-like family protein [Moritella viscosa]